MIPNLGITKDQFIHTSPIDIRIQIDHHQSHIFSENVELFRNTLYILIFSI